MRKARTDDDIRAAAAVRERFAELAWPLAWRRLQGQARAWLHIGAAAMALGSITALYARGWSREYRAVWESTLLHEEGDHFGTEAGKRGQRPQKSGDQRQAPDRIDLGQRLKQCDAHAHQVTPQQVGC